MELDREEVVALTMDYGGEWGIRHSERLLHLGALIGAGEEYDHDLFWLAAYLHDWGGYQRWAVPGVDHAERSAEVAAGFLRERGLPEDRLSVVLEAIRTHHSGGPGRCVEATLLSDADMLDLLGTVGVLRAFSMAPRELRRAFMAARERREQLPGLLCLERSRAMAETRLAEMDALLTDFERDSFDLF